jgi:hypothetical protein
MNGRSGVLKAFARAPKPSPAFVLAGLALLVAVAGQASASRSTKPTPTGLLKPNVVRTATTFRVTNGQTGEGVAKCPTGTFIYSGGYSTNGVFAKIISLGLDRTDNGYLVSAFEPEKLATAGIVEETAQVDVYAWCGPIGKPLVLGPPK